MNFKPYKQFIGIGLTAIFMATQTEAEDTVRARDLDIPFEGTPGVLNAITDVAGIEVGHTTLIQGKGTMHVGKGPIRTGVTAIHPRGKNSTSPVFGGWFTLNASGEMTGTTWLTERGLIDGPIMITNTHSVGVVRDASVSWMVDRNWPAIWHAPIVAETYDGVLNDINGFHVTKEHALAAMANAKPGPVDEGNVGGGTGMLCNGYKGGIGTSSRVVTIEDSEYTVGVLVQCNYGNRSGLRLAGINVAEKTDVGPICYENPDVKRHTTWFPYCEPNVAAAPLTEPTRDGSIIIVVATDAPLLPHQLNRVAKRPSLAIGRLGGYSSGGSGDIFIAFSTAGNNEISEDNASTVQMLGNNDISWIFKAVVNATEEAIVNAMVAAETMVGVADLRVEALPKDQIKKLMKNKP